MALDGGATHPNFVETEGGTVYLRSANGVDLETEIKLFTNNKLNWEHEKKTLPADRTKVLETSSKNLIEPDPRLVLKHHGLYSNPIIDKKSKKKRKTLFDMGFREPPEYPLIATEKSLEHFSFSDKLLTTAQRNIYPQLIVLVDGVQFNCHLIVLQCYSELFKRFRSPKIVIIPRYAVDPTTFDLIYKWMVGTDPLLANNCVVRMFKAALFLKVATLLDHLWSCMEGNGLINAEKAIHFYRDGIAFQMPEISEQMLNKVEDYFLSLVCSREFVEFKPKDVVNLITNLMIGVNNEVEVFMAVVRWLDYNWEERKVHTYNIMQKVKFGLMHPRFITSLKEPTVEPEIKKVISMPQMQDLINHGLRYSMMCVFYSPQPGLFDEWLESEGIKKISERKWIFDAGCAYHHRSWCKQPYTPSYLDFKSYLEELKLVGPKHRFMLESASDGLDLELNFCCK